jgi:tRNA-dihydrouridine synthase
MSSPDSKREKEDRCSPAVERLVRQVERLRALQAAAEAAAALHGMTSEESFNYKARHYQIKKLMRKLAEQKRAT